MCVAPLAEIIEKHNISYHFYADYTQIYLSFCPSDKAEPDLSRSRIELCVQDINRWMTANILKLNNDKTDLLVFTARHRPQPMLKSIYAGTDLVNASDSARNISVCFDNLITMEKQITLIYKSAFYHLRNTAFVSTKLDYCISLLSAFAKSDSETAVCSKLCRTPFYWN